MYRFSQKAKEDTFAIYEYTLLEFGVAQADSYAEAMEAFSTLLAGMPYMGRAYSDIAGVMRIEFRQHIIFYTIHDAYILIVRILHQKRDHFQHLA